MMAECVRLEEELRRFEQEHSAGLLGLKSTLKKLEAQLKAKTEQRVLVEARLNKVTSHWNGKFIYLSVV